MKKILAALLLMIPLSAFAVDNFGLNVPEWRDFVPSAYIDVKEPKGLGKFNVTAKYWYDRRLAFEEALEVCSGTESYEERFGCYESLKVKQFQLNTEYNAKIEAQQNAMSGIPEMQNRTDTMLPINMFQGYTQMIPNELRGY